MALKVIVAGGSIGGLFTAAALRTAGFEVDVYERTEVELSGRGAGIVTHEPLVRALAEVGAETDALGVAVQDRVAFDADGGEVQRLAFPQVVTSWDRIHRILRACIPDTHHHLGRAVTGYGQTEDGVAVQFDDGRTEAADVLVGADGFRSAIRGQMLPSVQPDYAGYVVWRALAHEADLPPEVHDRVFDYFGLYAPAAMQIIGYPIAGPDNDLRQGHRRYNFVWYAAVPEEKLTDMLTDAKGRRHAISIPPPLVREDVLDAMRAESVHRLPPPFRAILDVSERPFFTPIYDHLSPKMADGNVALAGDAACVARPHVGMGVTKAAMDAMALARHLGKGGPVAEALAAYSEERVAASEIAYRTARMLGSYVFGTADPSANPDGRSNPHLTDIMRVTASVVG
ncbi:MAG: FAD binding domain-containing protein [Pseudomonadota bacterium]